MYKSNYGTYLPVYHTLTVNGSEDFLVVGTILPGTFAEDTNTGSVHSQEQLQ